MKDLLIFGDSFGEEENATFPDKHPMYNQAHSLLSYHTLLRESGKFNNVVSYAKGGSRLWAQFKLFKEHYTGNEHVVWFITDPCRFVINIDDTEVRIAGLQSAEYLLEESKRNKDNYRSELIKSAIDYILYMQDREEDEFKHIKILEEIEKIAGNNLVYIDSFNFFKNQTLSLHSVYLKENEQLLGLHNLVDYHKFKLSYHDLRRNHMTKETHKLFAKELIKKIETGEEIDMSSHTYPSYIEFSKYFVLKKP